MVFEDEEEDKQVMGFTHEAELDSASTGAAVKLASNAVDMYF